MALTRCNLKSIVNEVNKKINCVILRYGACPWLLRKFLVGEGGRLLDTRRLLIQTLHLKGGVIRYGAFI